MIIYLAVNRHNGKAYVGQTCWSLGDRIVRHLQSMHNVAFANALRLYGVKAFDYAILQNCDTREEAGVAEKHWISTIGCKSPVGYNLTDGGEGVSGVEFTPERRQKMSDAIRSNPERMRQLSEHLREVLRRPEVRDKLKLIRQETWKDEGRRSRSSEKHKLYRATPETVRKMSQSMAEYWSSERSSEQRRIVRSYQRTDDEKRRIGESLKKTLAANKAAGIRVVRPPVSDETRRLLSAAAKRVNQSRVSPLRGKPWSPARRAAQQQRRVK